MVVGSPGRLLDLAEQQQATRMAAGGGRGAGARASANAPSR